MFSSPPPFSKFDRTILSRLKKEAGEGLHAQGEEESARRVLFFSSLPPPPLENDRKLEIAIRERGKTRGPGAFLRSATSLYET